MMKPKLTLAAVAASLAALYLISLQSKAQQTSGDYLPAKLRQEVNRLKRDAEGQPTGPRNLVERGLILWEWINAYSLTGGPVPAIRPCPPAARSKGVLTVQGARLVAVQPHFDNRYAEYARVDPRSPNRVLFSTDTRSGIDSVALDLEGVTPSTAIEMSLEETREHDVAPPMVRPYATIPASTIALPFSELKDGLLVRESPVGRSVDSVFLQLVNPDGPKDGEFEFLDRSAPGQGDYYYVRVTQVNGAHAWSSPVWVGGESTR